MGFGSYLKDNIMGTKATSKNKELSLLTPEQQAYANSRLAQGQQMSGQAMTGLSSLAGAGATSAYNALPSFDQTFDDRYGNAMNSQFQNQLSTLQHSNERHSSGNKMRELGALNQHMQNMGQARGNMMMTDRNQQMSLQEQALQRQMQNQQFGLSQMANWGNAGMQQAKENVVQQDPGKQGMFGTLAGAGLGYALGGNAQAAGLGATIGGGWGR